MAVQQFVRMEDKTHPWNGEWPPPDRLVTAVIRDTDIVILVDPDDPVFGTSGFTDVEEFDITYWTRVEGKTSQLGDDAPAHLARGAKYERETTDA
jgi:hypothetical protein